MNKFTHACFIRKNTPELRKELKLLGYRENTLDDFSYEWLAANYGMFISVSEGFEKLNPDDIDCGDNEDLFLAIAALRDDSDINQWFKIPVLFDEENSVEYNEWFQAKEDGITTEINRAIEEGEDKNSLPHKATVEELIEYFGYAEDNNKCS